MADEFLTVWSSTDQNPWHGGFERYWTHPTVKKNLAIEREIDQAMSLRDNILSSGSDLVQFLEDWYYPWKFDPIGATNKNRQALQIDYAQHPIKYDNACRRVLQLNLADSARCLSAVGSGSIPGMRVSAASAFLAVLFPEWFGTVDQHTLRNLLKIVDPRADWLRAQVHNPATFFSGDHQLAQHRASLMVALYREQAQRLNSGLTTPYWTPRKVEMVVFALRS